MRDFLWKNYCVMCSSLRQKHSWELNGRKLNRAKSVKIFFASTGVSFVVIAYVMSMLLFASRFLLTLGEMNFLFEFYSCGAFELIIEFSGFCLVWWNWACEIFHYLIISMCMLVTTADIKSECLFFNNLWFVAENCGRDSKVGYMEMSLLSTIISNLAPLHYPIPSMGSISRD